MEKSSQSLFYFFKKKFTASNRNHDHNPNVCRLHIFYHGTCWT